MIRKVVAGSVLAAALLFAGQPVQAGWLCGPVQCVWVNRPVAVVPAYAATWAAPVAPSCFWRRGFLGRWRMICP
jgi:hypothetical protein